MASPPELELDNQLCFALYATSRAFVRAYAPVLADLGLTYPQYVTLLALWSEDDPVPMSDLSARLHLDSGTLTPLLKRLQQMGLVERQRDDVDERRVLISLTGKGLALKKRARAVPRRMSERLDLDLEAVGGLRDDLRRLLQVLDDA